jgi:tight adherence protein B
MLISVALFLMIMLLVAGSVIVLTLVFAPKAEDKLNVWRAKKERVVEKELDNMFSYNRSPRYIVRFYYILPPLFGILGYIIWRTALLAGIAALLGLFIPTLILKLRNSRRRQKFNNQILDMIMILSSSLKGGLSLLQSLEVVVEEMPAPMSQEIGLVVRENKMGITLEESLKRLDKRMSMEDLSLVVNSVLVARETGGDLTKVFSRMTTTIRDNRKLKENIKTLTLQGKLQGLVMSVLPIVFVFWVLNFNKHHFDGMMQSDIGRALLITAVILQVIGMVLIRIFSMIKI